MKRFVEGEDRRQGVLLPEYLDDFVAEVNQVRVIEAFVEELDLAALGFEGVAPAATGRPSYHPSDGSKFKAVNARDKNFTRAKLQKRMDQVEASIERYLLATLSDQIPGPSDRGSIRR